MPPKPKQPPAGRRTQQERTAESTRRLLESAVELFAKNGYEATTAAQISLHAGYSRAMVNARFGTKEALLDELLRTQYEERILPPTPPDLTGIDAVLATVDSLINLATEDRRFLQAMFVLNFDAAGNTHLRPRMSDWIQRLEDRLITALSTGRRDGTISVDVEPVVVARDIVHTGIGAAYTWIVMAGDHDLVSELRRLRQRIISVCALR